MKRKYFAAMLSGLLLPGAGQIANKQRIKGVVIIVLCAVLFAAVLYFFVMGYVSAFNDREMLYRTVVDFMIEGLKRGGGGLLFSFLGLIGIWIYATVDALIFGDDADDA